MYQHCSLIFAGSRLIAYGYNRGCLHAEIVALRKLESWLRTQRRRPRNLHMVNMMIKKKTGRLGESYPCDSCYLAAITSGIKTITVFKANGSVRQIGSY